MILVYWIILPGGIGIILLPFTPYFIKKCINKDKKPLPSFSIFSIVLILLVIVANIIWGTYINGHIYYEWDSMFINYSLISYDHPQIDGVIKNPQIASRMFYGLSVWHLYALWLIITLVIYITSGNIALWKNKNHKNYFLYKRILVISVEYMFVISIITLPLLIFLMTFFTGKLSAFSLIFLGK